MSGILNTCFWLAMTQNGKWLIFEDGLVSHLGGPNEQFGTHEKVS